jgi:hypothetical protein
MEIPPDAGTGVVLSATKELEPGTRAMLLLAEGLFRLDVVVSGDTLQTMVRPFNGPLRMGDAQARYDTCTLAFGEIAAYEPGQATIEFALGSGADRVAIKGSLATLRFAQRGTVRITAQAIVRLEPEG